MNPVDKGYVPEWHVQCANGQYRITSDLDSPQLSTVQAVVSDSDKEVSSSPSGSSTHSLDLVPLADCRKTRGQHSSAIDRAANDQSRVAPPANAPESPQQPTISAQQPHNDGLCSSANVGATVTAEHLSRLLGDCHCTASQQCQPTVGVNGNAGSGKSAGAHAHIPVTAEIGHQECTAHPFTPGLTPPLSLQHISLLHSAPAAKVDSEYQQEPIIASNRILVCQMVCMYMAGVSQHYGLSVAAQLGLICAWMYIHSQLTSTLTTAPRDFAVARPKIPEACAQQTEGLAESTNSTVAALQAEIQVDDESKTSVAAQMPQAVVQQAEAQGNKSKAAVAAQLSQALMQQAETQVSDPKESLVAQPHMPQVLAQQSEVQANKSKASAAQLRMPQALAQQPETHGNKSKSAVAVQLSQAFVQQAEAQANDSRSFLVAPPQTPEAFACQTEPKTDSLRQLVAVLPSTTQACLTALRRFCERMLKFCVNEVI